MIICVLRCRLFGGDSGLRRRPQRAGDAAAGDHLPDRLHIGARGVVRHVLAADVLGLGVLAFERQDQGEVVAHPNVGVRAGARLAQRRFGLGQLLGQRVGQAEIVEQEGFARRDLERVGVELSRAVMVAQFVLDRALHRHDRPVGPILGIGARQHVLGLRQFAGVGERLAVFAENLVILRRFDRRRPHHRRRLAVAGQRAQAPRVIDRGGLVAGILVVSLAPFVGVGAPLVAARRRRLRGGLDARPRQAGDLDATAQRRRSDGEGDHGDPIGQPRAELNLYAIHMAGPASANFGKQQ